MFNLKERHIVVVLVLIAVIFILFLSTRTPMCITEGLNLNEYNSMYKVENHNLNDSIINNSSYSNNNASFNEIESSKIIEDSEKEVKPIVLSKNQMNEYQMNDAEILEDIERGGEFVNRSVEPGFVIKLADKNGDAFLEQLGLESILS